MNYLGQRTKHRRIPKHQEKLQNNVSGMSPKRHSLTGRLYAFEKKCLA